MLEIHSVPSHVARRGRRRKRRGGGFGHGSEPTSISRDGLKTIPAAMAWGSDPVTLATNRFQSETSAADTGLIVAPIEALVSEQERLLFSSSPMQDEAVCVHADAAEWQQPLPDKLLFRPHSRDPLSSIDLSMWQDQLNATTVEDLLRRNSTFSKLILRGIRRDGTELRPLVVQYFGPIVSEIDISYSSMVDVTWLMSLATQCPSITRIVAAGCPRITDAAVRILARKKGATLLALNVAECESVTDDGVEILAKKCPDLQLLDFSGCPNVRDRSVYAISALSGLGELALDDCAEVSDEAARQLFTNVTRLRSLSMKGCSSLTEEGLRHMYEVPVPWGMRRHRNCSQLDTFRIGSNTFVSDEFIMVLTAVCSHLRTLEVEACPLIGGDEAMGKIGVLSELAELTLNSLQRVSDHGVQQFFSDQPKRSLTSLALIACPKVTDLSLKCLAKSARNLRYLRLDRNVSVTDRGMGYLAKGLSSLRLLRATHLGMVGDDGVRLIARKCLRLTNLDLSHCSRISEASFFALRRLRSLEDLGMSGCGHVFGNQRNNAGRRRDGADMPTALLTSPDFRTLRRFRCADHPDLTDESMCAIVVRNGKSLTFLDFSRCPRITAVGLTHAVKQLPVLKRLDVTHCEKISTEDVERLVGSAAPELLLSCATLQVDGFDGLHCSASAVDARLRSEIATLEREESLAVGTVQRAFRRYKEREKVHHDAALKHDQLEWAAVVIQSSAMCYVARCRRHYRSMRRARLMFSVFKWHRRARESITWHLATRHGDRTLLLRLVKAWRASVVEEIADASELAERGEVFFEHMLMKNYLRGWIRFMKPSRAKTAIADAKADEWWRERRKETLFGLWKGNSRRIAMRRTKTIALLLFMLPLHFENSSRQKARARIALVHHRRLAQTKAWEEFVGLHAELADLRRRFKEIEKTNRPRILRRNLLQLRQAVVTSRWSWDAKKRADAVAALSLQRRALRNLRDAGAAAAITRFLASRADEFADRRLLKTGWSAMLQHPAEKKVADLEIIRGLLSLVYERAVGHRNRTLKKAFIRQLEKRIHQRLQMKMAMAKVMSKFLSTMKSACFTAWKLHHRTATNSTDVTPNDSRRQLLERVFSEWVEATRSTCDTASQGAEETIMEERKVDRGRTEEEAEKVHEDDVVAEDLELAANGEPVHADDTDPIVFLRADVEKQQVLPAVSDKEVDVALSDEDRPSTRESGEASEKGGLDKPGPIAVSDVAVEHPPEYAAAAVLVQTAWRSFLARKRYEEIRTTRQWAAVKVQSCFRGRKARRVFSKCMRYKHIREMVKADDETEKMLAADRESRRLREYHQALVAIGRVVLGYKGRKVARERRRQAKLEEAANRTAERDELMRQHEETQGRLEILRRDKERAATIIQVMYRIVSARVCCNRIREENLRNCSATIIQCMIRFRAAHHEAAAMKRHQERTAYVHRGRQQQARFLRMAGLKNRHSQRPAIRLLRKMGADLMGFTTSFSVQSRDVVQGFRLAVQEVRDHKAAAKIGGLDAYRRHNYIKARQLDTLEEKRIRRGDAVKILDRSHDFCGFTGRVLHLDARDPGREVAEVKLDGGDRRVVYVRLLTLKDGKDDAPDVNMLKIDRMDIKRHRAEELALMSDGLLAWAEAERQWWRPHLAAVAIQRRVRGYMTRRATARKRYRFWTRERSRRLAFLATFNAANVATYQAVRAAVMLHLIRAEMVPTNMPWVPPVPPRLEAAVRLRRHRIILREEIRTRMMERARLAQKSPHKLQWKTTTHGPMYRQYHPSKETWAHVVSKLTHPAAIPDIFHSLAGPSLAESLRIKAQARSVFTRPFQFLQLEQSPHVRTAGRALFHGGWARADNTQAKDSGNGPDSESTDTESETIHDAEEKDSEGRDTDGEGRRGGGEDRLDVGEDEKSPAEIVNGKPRRIGWISWSTGKTMSAGTSNIRKKQKNNSKQIEKKRQQTDSRPHGEGYLEFLDGWGVSPEERTLYVTVVAAKDLPVMDNSMFSQSSDPFVLMTCNGLTLRTSTKYKNREPKFNETFDFDVSNPKSSLLVECWDEDALSNDYIGSIVLPLQELSDGKKIKSWFSLGAGLGREGNNSKLKGKSRGQVQLVLQWLPKATEDDVSIRIRLSKAAVVLQCWARTIVARRVVEEAGTEAMIKTNFAFVMNRRIQMCFRRYWAREELRMRKKHYRNGCILQKFARRKLAYRKIAWRRLQRDKATTIQCFARQRSARTTLARLREERRILERDMATRIQANVRMMLARMAYAERRKALEDQGVLREPAIPISVWLDSYGTDPYYPSRRVRRITEKAYKKILKLKWAVVETRFGTATLLAYPARTCLSEKGAAKGTGLRNPKRFVEAVLHAHADLHWPRKQRQEAFEKAPRCYRAFLELDSVPVDRTVGRRAIMMQCATRMWLARRHVIWPRRSRHAALIIQRAYRQYADIKHSALRSLQSLARRHLAMRRGGKLAREKRCAVSVQCAFRSRKARLAAAYKRVIRMVKVVGSSGCSDPLYGPSNCLVFDPSEESTLWTSSYGKVAGQWIAFDLRTDCPVGAIRLLAMANTTSPKQIRVECCRTKKQFKAGEWTLTGTFNVDMVPGWQQFELPRRLDGTSIARLWKVTTVANHGNTTAVAVNGIQFLLAKEQSPLVLSQSHSTIVTPPPVGRGPGILRLSVEGTAWPPHSYQWYRNGRALDGQTFPTLSVSLRTVPSEDTRPFRCIHCKHAALAVPVNAPRVICGNCETPFVFKEYEETCEARTAWETAAADFEATVKSAEEAESHATIHRDKARQEAFLCENESKEKAEAAKLAFEEAETALAAAQERLVVAREAVNENYRELLRSTRADPLKIHHDFEGVYECKLSNIRGGSIVRTVSSYGIYVFARDPPPLRLKVKVSYTAKEQLRRRYWPKYAWAFGWFVHGNIGGDILIKYHDGAVYDGPYVPESCLSFRGSIPPDAREPGHWGTWITKTGWTYEGPIVDNHFDKDCINGYHRLTSPGGEVYEGDMLDEAKHGMGEYRYADGTIYCGDWHRGQRQGFGMLIAPDGASYEGEFDHDMIHGEGVWKWPDGSMYAGQAKHGNREGKGIYVTAMRDAFHGNFFHDKPHGEGQARYCDGSSYTGEFDAGKRHGKGTLEEENGVRVIGTWANDKRDGEFELRTPVFIPELNETQDEVRTGLWEAGEFVEWVSPPVYPHATKQFYELFEEDDSQYDGVYAMLVAKRLPHLPRGVDPRNPRVIAIARRLAAEAGELCAADSIQEAKQQIEAAQKPFNKARARLQSTKALERMSLHEHTLKKQAVDTLAEKLDALKANRDKLEAEVEQFYVEDPRNTRQEFLDAVARLKSITGADWFMVRNYDQPPPVLAALMSAVCTLMLVRDSWKSARNLVGSSVQNMEDGEVQATRKPYDCKLVYRLEEGFDPYARCDASEVMMKLATFVVDPRFEGESLFLRLYGEALGPLAEIVKTGYNYIAKAADIKPRKVAIEGVENNIKYTCTCLEREREEEETLREQLEEKISKMEEAVAAEEKARAQLEKAKAYLEEAQSLVTVYVAPRGELDPYEKLEAEMDPELTEIEVVLELLSARVEAKLKHTTTIVPPFEVTNFICAKTEEQVSAKIKERVYTCTAGKALCHNEEEVVAAKIETMREFKRRVNSCLRDKPSSKNAWKLLKGRKVEAWSIEALLDTEWDKCLKGKAVKDAVENWSMAFPGEGEAPYQAMLSVSNSALSAERKAEAQLWLDNNADKVLEMEWSLAGQFAESWPDNTAEGCIQVLEGHDYGVEVRLQATAWEKNNSEAVRQCRADNMERLAQEFNVMWESEEDAARQVLAIRERQDAFQLPYAEAWATFHLSRIVEAEEVSAKSRSAAFENKYPERPAVEAVRIVACHHDAGSDLGTAVVAGGAADEEEATRQALAWCSLHARAASAAEGELVAELLTRDVEVATDQDALERRLERLRNKGGEDQEDNDGECQSLSPQNRDYPPSARDEPYSTNGNPSGALDTVATMGGPTSRQETTSGSLAVGPAGEMKGKATTGPGTVGAKSQAAEKDKKKTPGVKKSKAQQLAEKEEAERLAREEEAERLRREVELEEEALRAKGKTKTEEVADMLRGKLEERIELFRDLLTLLRRARDKAEGDDYHTKALGDAMIRPSERQGKHDELLEERRKTLEGIAKRMSDIEARHEEARAKLEALGGPLVEANGPNEGKAGWASYLDEQSGRYYWFNEHTGEAYYDDDNA